MKTAQDVKDLVEEYRKEYPALKSQISIEALEAMAALHGPDVIDTYFEAIQKHLDAEVEVLELVRIGVPFEDAVKQVYVQKGDDSAQV